MESAAPSVDTLHTHVVLTYRFGNGHKEELLISARLFHLLMEIKEGYQLSGVLSDDVFTNLSIFKQRLAQENEHSLFASNPADGRVFRVSTRTIDGFQKLVIRHEERG